MSCLHITGTRRIGNDAPFRFTGKVNRIYEIEQNARHENPKVRAAAAAHPMATPNVLLALAHDPEASVREWVARNPKASDSVLRWLSTDEEPRVRAFVAWNPNAADDIINFLAEDEDETVRNMAKNVLDNREEV